MVRSATWVIVWLGAIGCSSRPLSAGDDPSGDGDGDGAGETPSNETGDPSNETGDPSNETGDPMVEVEPPACDFAQSPLPEAIGIPRAAGDFDGDGHVDLLAVENDTTLRVWLGDGVGSLSPTPPWALPESWSQSGFVVGDVDGDGLDEFGYHHFVSGGIWMHGFDGGVIAPGVLTPIGTPWIFYRLVDTNSDGWADLTFGGPHSSPAYLYLSTGDGAFVEYTTMEPTTCFVQDGDWADVDQNGEPDLLLVDNCNGGHWDTWVSVYTQHDGMFERREDSPQTVPLDPVFVRAGEFDGQPGLDIVAQSWDMELPIVIHHGYGDGSFGSPQDVDGLQFQFSLRERVDLDEDGLDDLIAQSSSFGVTWLHNLGNGEFSACVIAAHESYRLVAALDDDGPPRILTVDENGTESSWRL